MSEFGENGLPAIAVHGGAGKFIVPKVEAELVRDSLGQITLEAYERLKTKSALEAVVWAVARLEDDPKFNAGTGCTLQSDGEARLTASVMDGGNRAFAGVINIANVKNPIFVARELLNEKDRILGGEGAVRFGRERGFVRYNPITEQRFQEWKRRSSSQAEVQDDRYETVGAVALDAQGKLAAATSTGGRGMETPGRVSYVGSIAGTYASKRAAVSATGVGEEILSQALASRMVAKVDDGSPLADVMSKVMAECREAGVRAGVIAVDWKGHVQVETTTDCILHATCTAEGLKSFP